MKLLFCLIFSINLAYSYSIYSLNLEELSFEVSFGQSMMFMNDTDRQDILDREKVAIPTSSALLLVDFIYDYKFSFPFFLNLPLTSQKFLVDGKETVEKASTVFGVGVNYSLLQIDLKDNLTAIFSSAVLAGITINQNKSYKILPMLALELSLLKQDGFLMYLGAERTIGLDVIALFYGVGQRF